METKSLLKTMAASAFCVATFLFAACDKDKDKPVLNKLTFDKTTIEVTEGKTADLKVKNGTAPFRIEISGKKGEKVAEASVKDNTITVKGLKAGQGTLSVVDKNGARGAISVMVKKAEGTLKLEQTAVTLEVGKSQVVKVLNGAGPFVAIAKDPNVVETSVKGNEVTLTGRKVSATTVEVKDKDNNLGIISITVK